jgi:hypothetical protein
MIACSSTNGPYFVQIDSYSTCVDDVKNGHFNLLAGGASCRIRRDKPGDLPERSVGGYGLVMLSIKQ